MIDDAVLTADGLAPDGTGRVLLLACGALAHEIIALKKMNGWDHLDLQCLPAIFHNQPEKITPAITEAVTKYRDDYAQIFVVYADCGTGGQLFEKCKELGVSMIEGPHCYSFFETNDVFLARDEMTAFYLTDFLVRQFDAFVWEPLGLGKHPRSARHVFRKLHQIGLSGPDGKRRPSSQSTGLRRPVRVRLRIPVHGLR